MKIIIRLKRGQRQRMFSLQTKHNNIINFVCIYVMHITIVRNEKKDLRIEIEGEGLYSLT